MANLLGGSGSNSTTTVQGLDPDIKNAYLTNLASAKTVAGGLGVQQFAPRTGDYNAGQTIVRNAATNGPGLNAITNAVNTTAANINTPSTQNLGLYLNPYTDIVAGNTIDALGRANRIALNGVASDATRMGAFGGSRSGVAQAETNRNFADITGQTLGNIYNTGFNTALNASQNDLSRQLVGANQLATLGNQQQQAQYQAGQNVMNLGLTDQAFQQQILDATRNLPVERQQLINAALGLNPAGGSGNTSNTNSSGKQGTGIMGLFA